MGGGPPVPRPGGGMPAAGAGAHPSRCEIQGMYRPLSHPPTHPPSQHIWIDPLPLSQPPICFSPLIFLFPSTHPPTHPPTKKAVKFLKILSTAAVENWPDRNLPTLFLYKGGELRTQLLGLKKVGGRGMGVEDLEWWLAGEGVVETEMEEDPRRKRVGGLRRAVVERGYAEDEEDD